MITFTDYPYHNCLLVKSTVQTYNDLLFEAKSISDFLNEVKTLCMIFKNGDNMTDSGKRQLNKPNKRTYEFIRDLKPEVPHVKRESIP